MYRVMVYKNGKCQSEFANVDKEACDEYYVESVRKAINNAAFNSFVISFISPDFKEIAHYSYDYEVYNDNQNK